MNTYIFTSERLGFRNWKESDLDVLYNLNSDPTVMQYFPAIQTKQQSLDFINRMQAQFSEKEFCYFAVEILESNELIGFIGLSEQIYEADFNPSVDIGWRLLPSSWGKGYATEGAKRCLTYAFEDLNLNEIVSVAPEINIPSITVMQKIGMIKEKSFAHPLLEDYPDLQKCVLYKIKGI
ncbi:GNAT family N-acetyltransferase [Tenacibaculum amylolyticum]|uniref:GNAT family N-acetyltransferase n=1 Tax=Tenacibaculum amylolyticum TaxID=104269 RepID=UPI00389585F7